LLVRHLESLVDLMEIENEEGRFSWQGILGEDLGSCLASWDDPGLGSPVLGHACLGVGHEDHFVGGEA